MLKLETTKGDQTFASIPAAVDWLEEHQPSHVSALLVSGDGAEEERIYRNTSEEWGDDCPATVADYRTLDGAWRPRRDLPAQIKSNSDGIFINGERVAEPLTLDPAAGLERSWRDCLLEVVGELI